MLGTQKLFARKRIEAFCLKFIAEFRADDSKFRKTLKTSFG
jgi:hypothetical protein